MAEQSPESSSPTTWHFAEAQKLTFGEPVTELRVRLVSGTVNVVAAEEGPPASRSPRWTDRRCTSYRTAAR